MKEKTLLIKNGRVVDPAQNIDKVCNVLVRGGKVAEVTEALPEAEVVIDATGKIVCPGFIDIHTHEDFLDEKTGKLETNMSESGLHMGVTLRVCGNCGINVMDPVEYLDRIDNEGAAANVAMMAGHRYLREMNGGNDKYKPVDGETVEKMKKKAEEYLDKGCLGVSFGVKYIPGTTWAEITELSGLCRKDGKIVTSHVRNDVDGVFEAAEELARIGKECGVKVQFSHVGSMGGYGQMEKLLGDIEAFRKDGVDMMCDCYPYNAFSTSIGETTYDDGFLESYQADYDSILIVGGKYAGMRCNEAMFRELRATAPETATVGYFMKAEDVERALMSPLVMIGSDGIRQDGQGHPRASGSFAKFIREYVASGKISLSEGVAKVTSMAAERLGLDNKGNLKAGSDADIVIFSLDEVCDNATFENGRLDSQGFSYVLIGGEVALKDDKIIDGRLGRSVRR